MTRAASAGVPRPPPPPPTDAPQPLEPVSDVLAASER